MLTLILTHAAALIVGATIGMLVMALVVVSSWGDRDRGRRP